MPLCKACLDSGCHINVHHARQNASAKQARLDAERAREVLRQEMANNENTSNGMALDVVVDDEEV